MGVVCYTEDGDIIAVVVDPDPAEGTFLVCNLRKAVKEERKPFYDAIPADQIPIALRGSTEPLKGDTMLVPKAPYDILRFLAPATAVVALPLAQLHVIEGCIIQGWNVIGLRREAFNAACQHGAQRICDEQGIWFEDRNLRVRLFFSTEKEAVMTHNLITRLVDDRTRVQLQPPRPAIHVPSLQYVLESDYVKGTSPQPRTPSGSSVCPATDALSTWQSFEVRPSQKSFVSCHIIPKTLLKACKFREDLNFMLAMSSNAHDSFDGKLFAYNIPHILIQPLNIEAAPCETMFECDEVQRGKVNVRIIFLNDAHTDLSLAKGVSIVVAVDQLFGCVTFAVETFFFPPNAQLFFNVLLWRYNSSIEAWKQSRTTQVGADGDHAWYRLIPLAFLEGLGLDDKDYVPPAQRKVTIGGARTAQTTTEGTDTEAPPKKKK